MHLLRHAVGLSLTGVLVTACATAQAPPVRAAVRPGIDVLLEDSLHLVAGRAVGLLTNRNGVDRHGVGDVERLRAAGVHLVAIFTPEHGFRGAADPGAAVPSTRDSATGLPIYSLYGRNFAPTPEMLAGVQVLLVDLPDAGARYFTYISTTIELMRSPAVAGIPVIILDRPNPVGGVVQGNVLDSAARSFVGSLSIPMRHGLTLGELTLLAKRERGLSAALTVVPVSGWRRSQYFDATGLPFNPPSPNLRDLESIINYSGTCLFEGTNLSPGRGSDARLLPGWRAVAQSSGGAGPARSAGGRAPDRDHLYSPAAGRREVRRHPPAGDSPPGHRSSDLRPAGHGAPPPDGHPGGAPRRVRVDCRPFRPARRSAGAPRGPGSGGSTRLDPCRLVAAKDPV